MKNIAAVFADGVGKRMQTKALPKQFLRLHNKPIVVHTLEKFKMCDKIDGVVAVMVGEYIDYFEELLEEFPYITKIDAIVEGGSTGQLSIYNGLVATQKLMAMTALCLFMTELDLSLTVI